MELLIIVIYWLITIIVGKIGSCFCGFSAPCSGNADMCVSGICKCGDRPPCAGIADTCKIYTNWNFSRYIRDLLLRSLRCMHQRIYLSFIITSYILIKVLPESVKLLSLALSHKRITAFVEYKLLNNVRQMNIV